MTRAPGLVLTKADARRIAVGAQLLSMPASASVTALVRDLTVVRSTRPCAGLLSADHVLASRLGTAYDPDALRTALDQLELVEHRGFIRPMEDMALLRAEMAAAVGEVGATTRQRRLDAWVQENAAFRRDVLDLLRAEGPVLESDVPDTARTAWWSHGWNRGRNTAMMLEALAARGEIAALGGVGRPRSWDLASRVYPDVAPPALDDARRVLGARRLRALGIVRSRAVSLGGDQQSVGDAGTAATVAGVPGSWRVDVRLLDLPRPAHTAVLSPVDRLVQDRRRLAELFDFEFVDERSLPAERRRWPVTAFPVLHDGCLVGRLAARVEGADGVLRVDALALDVAHGPARREVEAAVEVAVEQMAAGLRLEVAWRCR